MRLEAIDEQDFHDCSYGFRQGRSPHGALRELREQCMDKPIGWIVDADISGFFDSSDRALLQQVVRARSNDGSILRLIGKWLHAGVMEDGVLTHPETGVPQGGVISPVFANFFLHHVLDDWFVNVGQPRSKGQCFLLRFADDVVIGCEHEAEARKILDVLPKRCGRYGLTMHPTKTTVSAFGQPHRHKVAGKGHGTFDVLGFTHYWTPSRQGSWVIKRKTARKRRRRRKKSLWQWCRDNRHTPLRVQYRMRCQKLRGHFQYYGIRGNYPMLAVMYRHGEAAWRYWLSRRSQQSAISWETLEKLRKVFPLPMPRIIHAI